ncbi:oxidoreductase [Halomonas sabkhae]|uniref:oxidoreductase n=1 Tax=Halomonas sabkhae TaxID=626223 RepID=UPI0025B2A7AE|nr:oxidoreductase [Halomonas sabkhae]MDN3526225.1 oxidoreductase [Halomonas sabkhae]
MKTQTLNVGLVGFGMAGRTFHAPLVAAAPWLELSAVVSGDAAKVQAVYPGMTVHERSQALFADPQIDLVVIATPNEWHFPLAKAALAAGKHVVVDKPMAVSLAEARQLKTLAENAQRLLSVFHNRRWDNDFLTLKALFERGDLGRITALESRFDRFRPHVGDRWREHHRPGSGVWFDLGPHLLDQARELFGMPRAILLELSNARDGAEIDDDFLAVLDYDAGPRVTLSASSLIAEPTPRFAVHGTRGSFTKYGLDPQEDWLKAGATPEPGWGVDETPARLMLDEGQGEEIALVRHELPCEAGDYRAYYDAIAETLLHGTPPPVTAESALDTMALLEAGLDSYRQGRWVKLKEGNGARRRLLHGKGE